MLIVVGVHWPSQADVFVLGTLYLMIQNAFVYRNLDLTLL